MVRLDSSVEDKLSCLVKETGRSKSYYPEETKILDYPEYQIAWLENPRERGGF